MKGHLVAILTIAALPLIAASSPRHAGAQVNPPQRHYKPVCGSPAPHFASCDAEVVTDEAGSPLGLSAPIVSSLGPVQLHTAYNLPCAPGGAVQAVCAAPASFGP